MKAVKKNLWAFIIGQAYYFNLIASLQCRNCSERQNWRGKRGDKNALTHQKQNQNQPYKWKWPRKLSKEKTTTKKMPTTASHLRIHSSIRRMHLIAHTSIDCRLQLGLVPHIQICRRHSIHCVTHRSL